jgi:ABC-type branched-subunit amino acid transport system substrate-binding protein
VPDGPGRWPDRRDEQRVQRRSFLRLVSAGLAAGGGTLPPRPARADRTADTLTIGMSAAFVGAAARLGGELYRGAQACYEEVNARGGVHGRRIAVIALDDGYEPAPCIRNTFRLLEAERVFLLSNYVGTPTLTRALPVIKHYADQHDPWIALVGNFTGAQPQREPPYAHYVFNIRASYRQEMAALVDQFWALGARRFGVFYQIDAYGRSGADAVARGLARHRARIAAEATYARGARFGDDMTVAVKTLQEAGVDVVLCTGAYEGCGAFIRVVRDAGWRVPISNLSFVGSDALLDLLLSHGRRTGRNYTRGLVNTQVMPSDDDVRLAGVRDYRAAMDQYRPRVPAEFRKGESERTGYSAIGLEGYANARVIVEGLRRAGPRLTRRSFREALESLRDLDLGIGAPLSFGPERHQGLDNVYFTAVEEDAWVPVVDWSRLVRA